MARSSVKVTIGANLGSGNYVIQSAPGGSASVSTTTLSTDVTAALTACTAAIANGTIAGDGTALGLVTAVQTAVTTVQTDVAALAPTNSGDVQVSWDTSTVTSLNQLRRAFESALRLAAGSGMV